MQRRTIHSRYVLILGSSQLPQPGLPWKIEYAYVGDAPINRGRMWYLGVCRGVSGYAGGHGLHGGISGSGVLVKCQKVRARGCLVSAHIHGARRSLGSSPCRPSFLRLPAGVRGGRRTSPSSYLVHVVFVLFVDFLLHIMICCIKHDICAYNDVYTYLCNYIHVYTRIYTCIYIYIYIYI